jgi:hypothetical protein
MPSTENSIFMQIPPCKEECAAALPRWMNLVSLPENSKNTFKYNRETSKISADWPGQSVKTFDAQHDYKRDNTHNGDEEPSIAMSVEFTDDTSPGDQVIVVHPDGTLASIRNSTLKKDSPSTFFVVHDGHTSRVTENQPTPAERNVWVMVCSKDYSPTQLQESASATSKPSDEDRSNQRAPSSFGQLQRIRSF